VKVIDTGLPGVLLLEPKVFGDARGFFMETWQAARYHEAGMPERFVPGQPFPFPPGRIAWHALSVDAAAG